MNDGLPKGVALFSKNIWDRGPELAIDPDGSLVAISKSTRLAYVLPDGETDWSVAQTFAEPPQSTAADPHTAGQLWVACGSAGLLRTDDLGRSWRVVFSPSAAEVSCDPTAPDRVAVASLNGVHLSGDADRTWKRIRADVPHREFPAVAIAGGTTAIGTKGNGVFIRSAGAIATHESAAAAHSDEAPEQQSRAPRSNRKAKKR